MVIKMRIITGKYRGRKISAPEGWTTRPTLQRAKESMFNMMPHILGGKCLDVFSGSGQLGIEALSRGCESCQFNEIHLHSKRTLQNNLESLKDSVWFINSLDYKDLVEKFKNEKFSVILIDPPYPIAKDALRYLLNYIDVHDMLEDNGVITGEMPTKYELFDDYKTLYLRKEKKFSKLTTIWQYKKK